MHTLERTEKEYRGSVQPEVEQWFVEWDTEQYNNVKQVLSECKSDLQNGQVNDALTRLKSFGRTLNKAEAPLWIDKLEALAAQIPENVVLPQDENHFNSSNDDAGMVRFVKTFKRIHRSIRNTNTAVGNAFLKVAKKEPIQPKEFSRNVAFKNLVMLQCIESAYLIKKWQKSQAALVSYMLIDCKNELLSNLSGSKVERIQGVLVQGETVLDALYKSLMDASEKEIQHLNEQIINKLGIAGTVEQSENKLSDEVVHRKKQSFILDWKETESTWAKLIEANAKQLSAAQSLVLVEEELVKREGWLKNDFSKIITEAILPHQAELVEFLESEFESVKKPKKGNESLSKACEAIQTKTASIIEKKIVPVLDKATDERTLSTFLETYAADISTLATRVEQRLPLIEDIGFREHHPEYSIKEIEWQSLFRRLLGDEYLLELLPEQLNPEQDVAELAEEFSEVVQIIKTNLSIAPEADNDEEEGPLEIVTKGLELALVKLEDLKQDAIGIEQALGAELNKHHAELMERVKKLLLNQDASEIKWTDAQMRVKESASDYTEKISIYWAKFTDRLEIIRRFSVSKFNELSNTVRSYFGLVEVAHINVQKTNIATLLYETDQKYRQLPYIYRRLFDYKRCPEEAFFIRKSEHFEHTARAYELWKTGFPSSVAVIGEKGSGRSSLITYLEKEILSDERCELLTINYSISTEKELLEVLCKQLKIQPKESINDIINLLNRRRKKTVILLENMQNSFLRTVQGYQAIGSLLYLVAETKEQVLWVCSCSRYAWNFLNVAVKISDYFSHTIAVDSYDQQEIKDLILKRQKASGYQLEFLPDANTAKSRSYKKLLDDPEVAQEYLSNEFFNEMFKMAEGNATVAMIYWIRSIQKIEGSFIYMQPKEFEGIQYLSELDSNTLFVINAFVKHDVLTASELKEVMNITTVEAETIISRLYSRGLLVRNEKKYSLNDLIYRQVVRLLKSRNFINA
ncbi:MAG: ATP-binding protein [Balneolaceae bacterium]|nr:ATP-binding protein [Balneolaceae bacterium]